MRGIVFRGHFSSTQLSTVALAIGLLAGGSGTAWAQDVAPPGEPANPKVQANGEPVQSGQDQIIVLGHEDAAATCHPSAAPGRGRGGTASQHPSDHRNSTYAPARRPIQTGDSRVI